MKILSPKNLPGLRENHHRLRSKNHLGVRNFQEMHLQRSKRKKNRSEVFNTMIVFLITSESLVLTISGYKAFFLWKEILLNLVTN